ncbi:MAG: aspartate aminotransferase family protein [Bacteroidales bacterium]|nr:aspartate aminotransferase family protein [Bacteroidales bacterium]
MKISKYQQIDKLFYAPFFNRYKICLKKGKGVYVWDSEGKKYIDVMAGVAVNSVGHCHPKVVKAIKKQAGRLIHISNFYVSENQARLAKKLADLSGLDRAFFSNSGAEANEAAFKMARKYAKSVGRGGTIVSFEGSFHGRTLATIAAGKKKFQEGFEPIPGGFIQIPFNNIDSFKSVLSNDIASIIIEPVQGEGGIHLAKKEYIKELFLICKRENIVIIFDEIQCGMGRTGKFFAFEHFDIKPDILTLAKALGGGFPIGATLCTEEISKSINYGDHGSTFGGNPLACAAALASIKVIEKENLVEKARIIGEHILARLQTLAKIHHDIIEVRGLGLMIGIEIAFPGRPVVEKLLQKGILGNFTADNVLRLLPPLIIKEKELNHVVNRLMQAIVETKNENNG